MHLRPFLLRLIMDEEETKITESTSCPLINFLFTMNRSTTIGGHPFHSLAATVILVFTGN
jgi:hypothetical protein